MFEHQIHIPQNVAYFGAMDYHATTPWRHELTQMSPGDWSCQYMPHKQLTFTANRPTLREGFTNITENYILPLTGRYINFDLNEPYGYHDGFIGLCRQPAGNYHEVQAHLQKINEPRFYLYRDAPIHEMFTPSGSVRRIRDDAPKRLMDADRFYILLPETEKTMFSAVPYSITKHGNNIIRIVVDVAGVKPLNKTRHEINNPQIATGRYKRVRLVTEQREIVEWVNQ